jgi:hypothetical protein
MRDFVQRLGFRIESSDISPLFRRAVRGGVRRRSQPGKIGEELEKVPKRKSLPLRAQLLDLAESVAPGTMSD